jgi:hypothetical protein
LSRIAPAPPTCNANPLNKMLFACSGVILVSLPWAWFDSLTPMRAAPAIWRMVVKMSMVTKTVDNGKHQRGKTMEDEVSDRQG